MKTEQPEPQAFVKFSSNYRIIQEVPSVALSASRTDSLPVMCEPAIEFSTPSKRPTSCSDTVQVFSGFGGRPRARCALRDQLNEILPVDGCGTGDSSALSARFELPRFLPVIGVRCLFPKQCRTMPSLCPGLRVRTSTLVF